MLASVFNSAVFNFAGVVVSVSLLSLAGLSCGKVGAPIPPARLSERTSQLTAVQRGAKILLTWPVPPLVKESSSTSYIERVDIYRLTEERDREPVLDPEDYEESSEIIGFLDRAAIEALAKNFGRLQYEDAVDLGAGAQLANTRLRYAIRYVNKRGQTAAFSNTVALEPSPGIALPPTDLRVTDQAQDAITIAWSQPEANVTGARPASVVGYNIYRRAGKRRQAGEPLNSEPLTEPVYTDTRFQYEADYVYIVRTLSQGADGLIESADSEPLEFTPEDDFPPTVPDPVSIASANGVVSLFWPTSPERDVAGYNIYRGSSADAPESGWTRLNASPHTAVTFRDDRVTIGQRYFYRVTAIDRFDNESDPSSVVSETANP